MAKQVSSSKLVDKVDPLEKEIQDKFNKTTIFLTKFIFGENLDILKKVGFTDSYKEDPEIMSLLTLAPNQRLLFLLFKNKRMSTNELRKIISELALEPVQIVFSYEIVNDYSMVVIDFPEKFIDDYDRVLVGSYSKLSADFKSHFPATRDVLNEKKERIGAEWTIYTHIFEKTEWLQNYWLKRLGLAELDSKLELWNKPDQTDLIFDVKNIIK